MAKDNGAKKARAPETGIVFPLEPRAKGGKASRGSTFGNQAAIAAALGAVDPALAQKALAERNWRDKYAGFFVESVVKAVERGHEDVGHSIREIMNSSN